MLHTYPLPFRFWAAKYRAGQVLRTTSIQQVPPACWPPSLKCRSRMHYYLADREAAVAEPGSRAVLLDQAGFVTEASTANLIVYTAAGGLLTPPRTHVLRGISLAEIADLAERLHIPLSERELRPADLAAADEVLLTSTPLCLLPVTRYDGRPIGSGAPAPCSRTSSPPGASTSASTSPPKPSASQTGKVGTAPEMPHRGSHDYDRSRPGGSRNRRRVDGGHRTRVGR